MNKTLLLPLICLSLLSGCGSLAYNEPFTHKSTASPICKTDKQCEAMWLTAQNEVQNLTGMRLQTTSNNFMQTYNPIQGHLLGAQVQKRPNTDGTYTIDAMFTCKYPCNGRDNAAFNLFNTNVNLAGAPFEPVAKATKSKKKK